MSDLSWMERAACNGMDTALWFPEPPGAAQKEREAKGWCNSCEVRNECLQYALRTPQTGIWGGRTEDERADMRRVLGIRVHVDRIDHGTAAGARAHWRKGETPCARCREAGLIARRAYGFDRQGARA